MAVKPHWLYNKGRGLPEPKWGPKMDDLQCPNCGSQDMYGSAHPNDPDEVFPYETVRCNHCGRITDWYEAHKQRINHPTDKVLEVENAVHRPREVHP